jgi:hypothetical protein
MVSTGISDRTAIIPYIIFHTFSMDPDARLVRLTQKPVFTGAKDLGERKNGEQENDSFFPTLPADD